MPRSPQKLAWRHAWFLVLTAAVMTTGTVWAGPASGQSALVTWDIADPPGDANNLSFFLETPDTSPASDDRADIRRVRVETTFETVKELTKEGTVRAVRYIPEALRITVQTKAPARPATGPTVLFVLSTEVGECYPGLSFKIRGPLSFPEPEVPLISNHPPDGVTIGTCFLDDVSHPRFSLTFQGDTARMEFPFDALAETTAAGSFAVGTEVLPGPHRPSLMRTARTTGGGDFLFGVVDATAALPGPYVIGSDVPSDIDCIKTPAEPACKTS